MRVYEVAREFEITSAALLQILREMGVAARTEASGVDDTTVAKLRARFERERRAGHTEKAELVEAVIEESQATSRRRRRRKKEDVEEVPEAEAVEEVSESPVEIEAEAQEEPEPEPEVEEGEPEVEAPVAEAFEAEPEAELEEEVEEPVAKARPRPTAREAVDEEGEGEEPSKPKRRPRRVADLQLPSPTASAGPGGRVSIKAEGFTPDGRRQARAAPPAPTTAKDKRKKRRGRVDQGAVQENVQRTIAEMKSGGTTKRRRRTSRDDSERMEEVAAERQRVAEAEAKTVRVNEFLTAAELAELIDVSPSQIISSAFKNLGLMVTINQRLDFDQIELLLDEFGFVAAREEEYGAKPEAVDVIEDAPEDLKPRSPVVTVMGHVDHGKTSLLDFIRKTNVIAGESGGITQHIGAYNVTLDDGRSITFLDTPGHAAFTAMRARGAEVTDVVILVVAADDSVMPQTIEAISHARNAGVPLIVAINKVDLPAAKPGKVKQQLLEHEVVLEEYGGEVMSAEVSAKTGAGVDELLDKVLLLAEMQELSANPSREAQGTVIEAELDVGKGPVATVLVTAGTLRVGDSFVCGMQAGRVRALLDERGHIVREAGPATPVQVLGMPGVPQAGDRLVVMEAERAGEISETRTRLEREKKLRVKSRGVKLTDISRMLAEGKQAQLNVIIKGDADGSVQALSDSLEQLATSEVQVDVIHRGVGAINESDVLLAATSGAIIIGFHVRPDVGAREVAEREDVDVRLYSIIYEVVEEIRAAMEGMLSPDEKEVLLGTAEVRQLFKVPKAGTVAGCYVTSGVIERGAKIRLVRDDVQVYQGELSTLKRFKDDVREVREGYECGLSISNFNDIKVGDVVEAFRIEEVARTLAGVAAADRSAGA
ncbi:MAG TPA: translation initiation factor IF-2 [Longimicrobiales bacterium]|nr:translation initiation factor IF-2 [Longimicrobiales bacterium]